MNKKELIDYINARGDSITPKQIEIVLGGLADAATHALSADGGVVTLPGLGKLVVKTRAPRTGRNPVSGEEIAVPARRAPVFKAAKALKDALNP